MKVKEPREPEDLKPRNLITSTSELAEYLGLSRWTVSRALNNHPAVSKATSQKVRDAAKRFNFLRSPLGDALLGKNTNNIGICFHSIDAPLLTQRISGIQRALRLQGCRSIIEITDRDVNREKDVLAHFISMRVSGMILSTPSGRPSAESEDMLMAYGKPVIYIDCPEPAPFPNVMVDSTAAYGALIGHLYELGHRQFGWLTTSPTSVPSRFMGIKNALMGFGLGFETNCRILMGDIEMAYEVRQGVTPARQIEYGATIAEEYLRMDRRPTALIASNDYIAASVIRRLQEAGLSVPGDVSVAGFDNVVDLLFSPGLTTIDQQTDELAKTVVQLMVDATRNNAPHDAETFPVLGKLVIRESTGPIKGTATRSGAVSQS